MGARHNPDRLADFFRRADMPLLRASLYSALASAAVLTLLLGAIEGVFPLSLNRKQLVVALCSSVSFLFAWLVARSSLVAQRGWIGELVRVSILAAIAMQPILLLVVFVINEFSRAALLIQLAGIVCLLFVTAWRVPGWIQVSLTTSILLVVFMLSMRPSAEVAQHRSISSSYHDLKVHDYEIQPRASADGGAVHLLDDGRVLLVNAEGGAHLLTVDGTRIEDDTLLNLNIPINRAEYIETGGPRPHYFRVVDIFVWERPEGTSLLSTYSYWDAANRCYVLRLSSAP